MLANAPAWMNRSTTAIGPRWPASPAGAWRLQAAVDFYQGLNRLVEAGILSSSSRFVSAALTSLNTAIQTQSAGPLPLDFLALASGATESGIASAMGLSLK